METGKTALDSKNYAEAERLFSSAVEEAENLPNKDKHMLDAMCQLAAVYSTTGKLFKASAAYQQVLNLAQKLHGAQSPNLVSYLELLAKNYQEQGEVGKEYEMYQRIVEIYTAMGAPAAVIGPFQALLDELQTEEL
jgi:tetratricopeptide (TPR) repeat protein